MVALAMAGAFWFGRRGGMSEAHGESPLTALTPGMLRQVGYDPNGHVVAYIFGDTPVTREELGEYLIQRLGAERLEFLINRKIIERACAAKGIRVTDAEINAQYMEELAAFQCNESQFYQKILMPYKKTLYEWKEDVIRPKLSLERYVRDSISIDQADIQKAYEAKFGPKVECLIYVITKEQNKDKDAIWARARQSTAEFEKMAKEQPIVQFAAKAGKIDPIHKHFPDPNVEREAFKLQVGETSPQIAMADGTIVILHCIGRQAANTTTSLDQERMELHKLLFEGRVAQQMRVEFDKLRQMANPQIFLRREQIAPFVATANPTITAPSMPQNPVTVPVSMPTMPSMPDQQPGTSNATSVSPMPSADPAPGDMPGVPPLPQKSGN